MLQCPSLIIIVTYFYLFVYYREVSRTAGISTTDLVGRMLLMTRNHFRQGNNEYLIEKEGKRIVVRILPLDYIANFPTLIPIISNNFLQFLFVLFHMLFSF